MMCSLAKASRRQNGDAEPNPPPRQYVLRAGVRSQRSEDAVVAEDDIDTKLVRTYRTEHRVATRVRTRLSVTVTESGQLNETAPVVDSGLVEGGVVEDGL